VHGGFVRPLAVAVAMITALPLGAVVAGAHELPINTGVEELPSTVEKEARAQASDTFAGILLILEELGIDDEPVTECEPVTVTAHVNETNPKDPVDYEVRVQWECVPA